MQCRPSDSRDVEHGYVECVVDHTWGSQDCRRLPALSAGGYLPSKTLASFAVHVRSSHDSASVIEAEGGSHMWTMGRTVIANDAGDDRMSVLGHSFRGLPHELELCLVIRYLTCCHLGL